MWKNTVEADRPHKIKWLMRTSCCITKATNTHSEYVILIDFPLQQWLHDASQCYVVTCIASLVLLEMVKAHSEQ